MIQKLKNIYHLITAVIAVLYYKNPGKKIKTIGVTGTDGKTTTTTLIAHILKSAGKRVSYITSVSATVGGKEYETGFHTTTPSPFAIQKYLSMAVKNNDEYFVLETTSHALDQHRIFGVSYFSSIITNITHEHLQYHKTYKNYVLAKSKLIKYSKRGYINKDDISYKYLEKILNMKNVKTYGFKNNADYSLDISQKLNISLPNFNNYNFLGAYALCLELGIKEAQIFEAIKSYKLPSGRMEVVYNSNFKVIVDFAHTPNSLHEALPSIRAQHLTTGRLIHIFGCAAFRDDSKRPLMGIESARYADLTIITEEDYRTEDPNKIALMIAEGLLKSGFRYQDEFIFGKDKKTFTIINNRSFAIKKAIEISKDGDVIVLTGKGHERSLCRGKKEFLWSDKNEAIKAIKETFYS